jgi:protein ImuB
VELVERLSARLGDARVQAWQPCADHRPELMQRWVPARSVISSITAQLNPARVGRKRSKAGSASSLSEIKTEALYPAWLLPEPLKLATAGNNPVYQGKLHRLAGPQRLEAAEWLLADSEAARGAGLSEKPWALRDYFIYRSQQGGLLWVYSERLGATPESAPQRAWYLHGFFA